MLWTPGYWEYGADGYYWVAGEWVMPPSVGLLWTPGYWRWNAGIYLWSDGYWDRQIGYYGGVNYGYGYVGSGYQGGYWNNGRFFYNRNVNNLGHVTVHNVYERPIEGRGTGSRVSFNGGAGGTSAHPSATQVGQTREAHQGRTPEQSAHREAAAHDHTMLASSNAGHPPATLTGNTANTPARGRTETTMPIHVSELPPIPHAASASTGNAERDIAQQKERDALSSQQARERQVLQARQEQEHAAAVPHSSATLEHAQLEQQHQSQTRELVQRHASEQETLRQSQARPVSSNKPRAPGAER